MLRPLAPNAHATLTPAPRANVPHLHAKSARPSPDYHPPLQLARPIPPPRTPQRFPPAPRQRLANQKWNCRRAPSLVRSHNHAIVANNLTASRVGFTVNRHAAFKTNSHSAKRRPRLSRNRSPKSRRSCRHHRRGHACSRGHHHIPAIHGNFHALSGLRIHGIFCPDHMARAVSPIVGLKFHPPIIFRWPSKL